MNPSYLFIILPILSLIAGTVVGVVGYRKWRAKGIFLGIITFLVLSAVLATTVIPAAVLLAVTDPTTMSAGETYTKGMNEALFGTNTALKKLPVIENVEQVIVSDRNSSNNVAGCYHAWTDVLYGTALDPSIVADKFVQQLQPAGWQSNDVKQTSSRVLIQGENTQFSIEYGGEYADYWKQQGYEKEYLSATTKYANVLNARIDYFVPGRAKCTQ